MFDELSQALRGYLPNLLIAIAILAGGVPVAWIIARLVHRLLNKARLSDCLKRCQPDGETGQSDYWEKLVSRIVFWILILFVLAGFFQALRLQFISDPLINMLQTVFGYLPRPLAAVGLAVLAWVLALSARMVVVSFLGRAKLDEKISEELVAPPGAIAEKEIADRVSLSRTLGDVAYWLVLLLFIPPILDALGLQGLLAPLHGMLNKILAFLPNLFVAVMILGFGYFAAKIVSRIVTKLLKAAGIDRLAGRTEADAASGRLHLATLIGYVVFVLVLVPIVIAALQSLQLESVTRPAEEMLTKFLAALPNMFAAVALLTVAYYVGRLLVKMVGGLLDSAGFDGLISRMGLTQRGKSEKGDAAVLNEEHKPSRVVGHLVLVAVMLVASEAALRLIEFQGLANLLNQALVFLGNMVLGLIVIATGLYLGALSARLIRDSNMSSADILAPLARGAIIVFLGAMGLEQMGIGRDIIRLAFGLTLGAIAIAAAIAFGIGSRDLARNVVTKHLGHLGKNNDLSAKDNE